MKSFHDFNIFEYHVSCKLKEITLMLKEHHGNKSGTLVFRGVVGHHFENVLEGNIVLECSELNAVEFYNEFESQILSYQKCGLPVASKNQEEFIVESKNKSFRFVAISTSYGLSGWVICTEVTTSA